MAKRLFLLALAVPFLVAADDPKTAAWKEFSNQPGRFKIQVPGTPKEQSQSVKTAVGDIEVRMFSVEFGKGNAYIVAVNSFPKVDPAVPADQVLDGARDGAVANVKGKLASEKKIKIGQYPGREIVIEVKGQAYMRTRIYLVKDRLYQVMVAASARETLTAKDSDKFLDSFKLSE